MDSIRTAVLSPYAASAPTIAPRAEVTTARADGYTPGVNDWTPPDMRGAAAEISESRTGFGTRAAVLAGLVAIGILGGAIGTLHASDMPTVSATRQDKYSDPARPLPDNAVPDEATWSANGEQAFKAYASADTEALTRLASRDGVWIRGLQNGPETSTGHVFMTHEEFARDLKDRGDFYQQVFESHSNGRFVITPDAQGHIQGILLD